MSSSETARRRTVATRVLLAFTLVAVLFSVVAGWGVFALRRAAAEADLVRSGYLPLSLALRDVVASQDTWNTQLNHITTARNPADKRVWFDTAMRIGRPRMFGEVRAALDRAFMSSGDESLVRVGRELTTETTGIENSMREDRELLAKLFGALAKGETTDAEASRDKLVTRGALARKRLSQLEQRVQGNLDLLLDAARARERLAIQLLVGMAALALLLGIMTALYTRRVLSPLAAVTQRAMAVSRGDLTPRPVALSNDEIGELAQTFEDMVAAIARANEQLLAAERLATIGKMAAHVTHEIRNPLSSIGLNVELLEEEVAGTGDSESGVLVRAIKNEVERLTALSGQYLSMARQKPLRPEREDVGVIVAEACEFMRRDLERHGVHVETSIAEDLPAVLADEAQIKQALYNLLRNAREVLAAGGTIQVRVTEAAGGGVDLRVVDDGPGIDAAARERIFEPFFTTKHQGTGLGLAITRQIIEAHGGTIACEGTEGGGTTFWMHLPESVDTTAAETPGVEALSGVSG